MTLTLELTPEEQERLDIEARARGISLNALVHDVLKNAGNTRDGGSKDIPALPAWKGTVIAPLSREDLYGDAG